MSNKDLKNNIAEYGFLAEHEISMTRARALELCDEEGVPSFERLVERARAKSDLPEEAWAPAKKAVRRPRGRISIGAPSLRFVTALGALVLLISFFAMTNSGKALAEAAIRTIEERVDTIAPLIDTAFKTATEEVPPESTAAAPHHQGYEMTPELSALASEEPTPASTAAPAASASPETSAPTGSECAAEAPTASPTAEPTEAPTPEPTATPTATPVPTATPAPTNYTCGEEGCVDGIFNQRPACTKNGGLHVCSRNFPDAAFRAAIEAKYDGDGDNVLSKAEANYLIRIEVPGMGVTSVKGVEFFCSLLALDCSHNSITELDLRYCSVLGELHCNNNELRELDVDILHRLWYLDCSNNPLTELKLGATENIEVLYCSNCLLTSLSCGMNYVRTLNCSNNRIESLYAKLDRCYILNISNNRLARFDPNAYSSDLAGNNLVLSPQNAGSITCLHEEDYWQADLSAFAPLGGMHERISAVYGLNAEGQWVQGAYHQRKGLARFEFRPSYIRYVYDAGVGDMLVDLAVIASE